MQDEDDDFDRSPVLPFGLLLLSLAALAFCLTWPGPRNPGYAVAIGALALVAEQLAPASGSFGFFPLAMPLYLIAILNPEVGPQTVGLIIVAALGLRTALRGQQDRWLEATADLFPLAVATLCRGAAAPTLESPLDYLRWALPVLAYLFAWATQPGFFTASLTIERFKDWSLVRERALSLVAFLALSSLGGPAFGLLALLARPAFTALAKNYKVDLEERLRREEEIQLSRTRQNVTRRQREQELSGQELALQTEVYALLGEMLATMSSAIMAGEASRRLLSALKLHIPCRSMALYINEEGRLTLSGSHSPNKDAPSWLDPGSETLLKEAWDSQLPQQSRKSNLPGLFPDEESLAVPIPSWGVLYVGDTHPTWEPRHLEFLTRLAPHLRLYIDSSRYYELQAKALDVERDLRRQLESALRELKESQAALIQSSKLAAIGQLAAGVAHELNTPLAAISVAIDGSLMTLDTKPDRARARLEKATASVEQMREIISKLLFYSRDARSGRSETDLNQVVRDSLQLVGHQLRLDNIEVDLDLRDLPPLNVNANELQQVITNLLLNAKDAMLAPGAPGKRVLIASRREGERSVVSVRDQGVGMTEAVRLRIFEPFYTTKDVGKGTGLGLSTSLQLVQQHGGELKVESQVGQGTTFTIRL